MSWMIYGATGYTGTLIAETCARRGLAPTLAGRDATKLRALSERLNLPYVAVSLDNQLNEALSGFDLVLHCAGPFSATAEPMMQACLATGTHYLDITGEVDVFERAAELNDSARQAGIVLMPGVGFDVIPTDCVAARLKAEMPDAQSLSLGFDSRSGFSPGTAKTSVEALPKGGLIRRGGQLTAVPLAYRQADIDFGNGTKHAATIPWGDVSTAWHSTGIPNIEVYLPMSPRKAKQLKKLNALRWLLGWGWVQRAIKKRIEQQVAGPDEQQRQDSPTWVWGRAENASGEALVARVKVANGYEVTVEGALAMVERVLSEKPCGFLTPSQLAGWQLVEQLPGSGTITLSEQ
ncbi:saccharopine dehydrogenase family protein [Ferrimonas balearica]|uniref:saccharopine dehydrogenase family protein n=1 Tax=Ferrimonas balearica TaxID=44012 RepID=UPI001C995C2C|nr:saccharopine dehydrogenase NADP-binding domain-containing protein [Ferrimonas balearica]MBY5920869.1 saccharopine dehydrogenase NADP-binding domain-containing protein [Ferrimonas balearica]MBY5996446.1 saccharopine dehydrogenase NADP-binding domain-containing protein [Ferrimonas balearica]